MIKDLPLLIRIQNLAPKTHGELFTICRHAKYRDRETLAETQKDSLKINPPPHHLAPPSSKSPRYPPDQSRWLFYDTEDQKTNDKWACVAVFSLCGYAVISDLKLKREIRDQIGLIPKNEYVVYTLHYIYTIYNYYLKCYFKNFNKFDSDSTKIKQHSPRTWHSYAILYDKCSSL